MVDIRSQQNAVGFDTCRKMEDETLKSKENEDIKLNLCQEDIIKEDEDLPEEGEITDEDEPAPIHTEQHSSSHSRSHSHHRSHHSPSHSSRTKPSSSRAPQSSRNSKPAPKYKDFDAKTTKPVAGEEIMMESWLNGVQKKRKMSPSGQDPNEEYYGVSKDGEKKGDENSIQPVVDEFGDVDYRQMDNFESQKRNRRRSESPIDGFGTMAKRARNDSDSNDGPQHPPPQRRGPIKNRWTEKTICKFFREGYCRETENCSYSHNAADSHRRPELCRYYQNGYCKRGLACPNLHGEFPCRAFNKGECSKDQCQFSHQPLNDYTRPIFEQMMRDEELATRLSKSAGIRPQRKVLLPKGPDEWDRYFYSEPAPESRSNIPPPSLVLPTLSNGGAQPKPSIPATITAAPSKASSFGFFNAVPASVGRGPPGHPNNSPHQIPPQQTTPTYLPPPSRRMTPPQNEQPLNLTEIMGKFGQAGTSKVSAPSGSLSPSLVHDSLQSLQSMFDSPIVDESPRSPPHSQIVASDSAPVIPITRGYIAYPLFIPDTCSSVDLNLIQQLTSGRYKNDPRLKRMAEKQFDLVSKTLEQQGGVQALLQQKKPAPAVTRQNVMPSFHPIQPTQQTQPPTILPPNMPADPRARDPRTLRSTTEAPSFSPKAVESDDFSSMVAKQIEMANQLAKQTGKSEDLDMRTPASSSSHYETRPDSYYDRRTEAPAYDPHLTRGHSKFARGSSQRGQSNRFNKPEGDYSGKRCHEERDWNENSAEKQPKSVSPMRPDPKDETSSSTAPSAPLTLREKRKHNTYESPLSGGGRRF